jgi:predicted O-linked N-acetylglucosamine transferase (SPINDLY family)
VNEQTLQLWAAVLRAVPTSRFLLLAPRAARARVLDVLLRGGVRSDRVDFVDRMPRKLYLATYYRIDIGLDTIPYNGHTTTLDALWMGVPVVTLIGNSPVSRAGWSQLNNLGLQSLAASSPEQFVQIAGELCADIERLRELRGSLRNRLEGSPLMDGQRFARHVEAAYRAMWEKV